MTNYSVHVDGKWLVPNRWHIDDVKYVIEGSEYENEPMPSDEKLMDYLYTVVGTETWIELMNEQLAMHLHQLFNIEHHEDCPQHEGFLCPCEESGYTINEEDYCVCECMCKEEQS